MGRLGISYSDVANAASELKNQGFNPTVDGVRSLLGTGSKSTIVPYLRQWRAIQAVNQEGQIFSSSELLSLIRSLYERLQEEPGTIAGNFKKQISKPLNTNLQLSKRLEEVETEKQYLQKEIIALKAQLALSEKEKLYLIEEKTNLREELKELSKI